MVAEFESEDVATEVGLELKTFFTQHAAQKDEILENDGDWEQPTQSQLELGKKYGFDNSHFLAWGDEGLKYNEPTVVTEQTRVLLYHDYCGGIDINQYIAARDGKTTKDEFHGKPELGVLFQVAENETGANSLRAMRRFFAQAKTQEEYQEFRNPFWQQQNRRKGLPYAKVEESVFYWDWSDGEAGGFYIPFYLHDLDSLKTFFQNEGFLEFRIIIGDESFKDTIRTLSRITHCPNCDRQNLKLFEVDSSMLEDQIGCRDCGAMYALSVIKDLQPLVSIGDDQVFRAAAVQDSVYVTVFDGKNGIWRKTGVGIWEEIKRSKEGISGIYSFEDGILASGKGGSIFFNKKNANKWTRFDTKLQRRLWNFSRAPGGRIYVSGNGGAISSSENAKVWTGVKSPTKEHILDIAAFSDDVLLCCTVDGAIFLTRNGGKVWRRQETGVSTPLCRICALNSDEIVVVGDKGVILTTKNCGTKWTKRATKLKADVEDITMGNDGRLYAVAGDLLLVSANKGAKWEQHPVFTGNQKLWGLTSTPSGSIYCVGNRGTIARVDGVDSPAQALEITPPTSSETDNASSSNSSKARGKSSDRKSMYKTYKTIGKSFLFTGKLSALTRAEAKSRVADLGGVCKSSVVQDLDYLVVGDEGSPLFGNGKKGSKLNAAEKLVDSGAALVIMSETDFKKLTKK